MRYVSAGVPMDRQQTWRQIAVIMGHQQLRGYSILAIDERATGAFLGRSVPWFPLGWPMLEVGWVVDPRRHGEGFATEAGRASLEWCFQQPGVEQVCSVIHPENVASARVAVKLGGTLERSIQDGSFSTPVDLWVYRGPPPAIGQ